MLYRLQNIWWSIALSLLSKLSSAAVRTFIQEHERDDPATLMLQASRFSIEPFREIVAQIGSRQRARHKLPAWYSTEGILFPPQLSMEQCSSELTAAYKQKLAGGDRLIDLTGGTGVDTSFLSKGFEKTTFVERDLWLCQLAEHNFPLLGQQHIEVQNTGAEEYLDTFEGHVDLIYIDPARRDDNKNRVAALEDCTPDVIALQGSLLAKARRVLIKAAPMLDIKAALRQLEHVQEVYVLAVAGEVKEVLFLLERGQDETEPTIHAVNLSDDGEETLSYRMSEEAQTVAIAEPEPGHYLYEPNAAVLKAGAFNTIASRYGLAKLHAHSHLYVAAEPLKAFPGRGFEIKAITQAKKKALQKVLPAMKANITVRNFPASVVELRKKTGIKEGGEDYLFATTTPTGHKILVCSKNS